MSQQEQERDWWSGLKHHGLLLGPSERKKVETDYAVSEVNDYHLQAVRREFSKFESGESSSGELVQIVMEKLCGFRGVELGQWERGSAVSPSLSVKLLSGDNIKPSHLWKSNEGGEFSVFISSQKTLGVGKGRKSVSDAIQWLRRKGARLALVTNCRQWRLIYAGLDYEAWCEWDAQLWFEEGKSSAQLDGLRLLLQPSLYDLSEGTSVFASLVQDSRKGQGELSSLLGERVREAVEEMVRSHGEALTAAQLNEHGADIYRAAVRVVMRLVVILFAESREMLPLSSPSYFGSYSLQGLFEQLGRVRTRGASRLVRRSGAWPRIVALFKLVYEGSFHESLEIPAYGGELFESGNEEGTPIERALYVFENSCFDNRYSLMSDLVVLSMLEKMMRTKVRIRQGRGSTYVSMPVDFSQLSTEYIGVLYEGLLDYDLRQAEPEKPVLFLAVGNEPALPLDRLEAMDDSSIKVLFESLKKKSGDNGAEDEEVEEADDDAEESEEEPVGNESDGNEEEIESEGEEARRRATQWAMRACEVAGLVRRLRNPTPERELRHRKELESFANKLSRRVILPGEWYLVRWGGTRKGSGTFYTKPQLAAPTVARTLRPLAYRDVQPDDPLNAEKVPRLPEEILSKKVCDPGCGSGSFLVSSLKYLTEALYESLCIHGRLSEEWQQRPLTEILGISSSDDEESLSAERLPCRPEDFDFELRVKAVLRRHVVERCIYGVDLDPLAVELCRLALWIETLDRYLPFSFIDHKIKCGNSLLGTWFDQFQHYPVMAWKNREAGDKNHNNGIHYKKGAGTKEIKLFAGGRLQEDLQNYLTGQTILEGISQQQESYILLHEKVHKSLELIHSLPVHESKQRALLYEKLIKSKDWCKLKQAFDQWCSCWFWPSDKLDIAPMPSSFSNPRDRTLKVIDEISGEKQFFHWELEFPDVFRFEKKGFDAISANPPWEIAKPESKEFFPRFDPLYIGASNPESRQTVLFKDHSIEKAWIDYNDFFNAWSNFVKYANAPFGDPNSSNPGNDRFKIANGKNNEKLHAIWRQSRQNAVGYTDLTHPFCKQGAGDLNLYKLFIEQMYSILANDGRLGLVIPAGIYNDSGSAPLREVLIDGCGLEWIFGFENRRRIFPIDSRFRFCCLIAQRGAITENVKMAFGRLEVQDWEKAHDAIQVVKSDLNLFSPKSKSIPEIDHSVDLNVMRTAYVNTALFGDIDSPWATKYVREFDMTNARKKGLFTYFDKSLGNSAEAIAPGHWDCNGIRYVSFYTGKMISQYDFAYQKWLSGHGNHANWEPMAFSQKSWLPEFVMPVENARHRWNGGTRLVFRDITNATNERTAIAAIIPAWPCGNKVPVIAEEGIVSLSDQLSLCAIMNSFCYDFIVRTRMTGINLNKFILTETAVPKPEVMPPELARISGQLAMCHEVFASAWLELLGQQPILKNRNWNEWWCEATFDRLRLRAVIDAVVATVYGLNEEQFRWVLRDCDWPSEKLSQKSFRSKLSPKGFWRVGIGSAEHELWRAWSCDPKIRLPVLALIAYLNLQKLVADYSGDILKAVTEFTSLNDSQGWDPPEPLNIEDYNLGQGTRSEGFNPVNSFFAKYDFTSLENQVLTWNDCQILANRFQKLWPQQESNNTHNNEMKKEQSSSPQRLRQGRLFE